MDSVDPKVNKACRHCAVLGPHKVTLCGDGVHYAKITCRKCGKFLDWHIKPDSDPTKYKRPQQHTNLAVAYGKGFCEMCLRSEKDFPKGTTLVGHHVIEYKDGGSNTRENIWVLCTACHQLVHWNRTYYGAVKLHNQATGMTLFPKEMLHDQDSSMPTGTAAVDRVAERPPW